MLDFTSHQHMMNGFELFDFNSYEECKQKIESYQRETDSKWVKQGAYYSFFGNVMFDLVEFSR